MFDTKKFFPPMGGGADGTFPPEKPDFGNKPPYSGLENLEYTKRELHEMVDRLQRFEQNMNSQFNDMLRRLTGDNTTFKQTFAESHRLFLEEVKNEINRFENNVDNSISLFTSTLGGKYDEYETNTKAHFDKLADELNTRFTETLETLTIQVEELERSYADELATFKTATQEQYEEFARQVNSRVDDNNTTTTNAFVDYKQKITTEINNFMATVNNRHTVFTDSITETNRIFRETVEGILNERLNTQDAKISDAELWMKTNLVGTVQQEMGDMREDGRLQEIIETECFPEMINYYVTPQMFGGAGDGVTDDTDAFMEAYATGKPVYVEGCKIGDCTIENTQIIARNMSLVGTMTIKDVELSGTITVNGGAIRIFRNDPAHTRDNTNIHDLIATIGNCETLFTLEGTMYNVRIHNITVRGKCSNHVIHIKTDTWLTNTLISHCFLGTCNNPIVLEDNTQDGKDLSDIYILYTTVQKIDDGSPCRFVSTNSGGKLYLIGSHMYDLKGENDSQIFIQRTEKMGIGEYNIVWQNQQIAVTNSKFALDSNGKYGQALFSDISDKLGNTDGNTRFPTMINHRSAYYRVNGAEGYGVSEPILVKDINFIGTTFKTGLSSTTDGREYMIGFGISDGKLKMVSRNMNDTTPVVKTFSSDSDRKYADEKADFKKWADGTPVFYTPLKKPIIKWGEVYYDATGTNVTDSIT